jgi:hypothetical protein
VKNYVENDLRKMGVVNWRQVEQDRNGRSRGIREVLILRR